MSFHLKPDNRNASDEELINDLKKVVKKLGLKSITKRDYDDKGRFHSGTLSRRFNGWNNALEKAGLKLNKQVNITDEELIADVQKIALEIAPQQLTQRKYNQKGKYTSQTIDERIGWKKTLGKLNIQISRNQDITEKELFDNLETLWLHLGHAPRKRDMVKPGSQFSEKPYIDKYDSWRKALESFVEYVGSGSKTNLPQNMSKQQSAIEIIKEKPIKHKTKRDISARLKVQVLIRDGNKCRLCGVTVTGENIHFDHIKPWAKGGETIFENIQVLCEEHNLAKGDYYDES